MGLGKPNKNLPPGFGFCTLLEFSLWFDRRVEVAKP